MATPVSATPVSNLIWEWRKPTQDRSKGAEPHPTAGSYNPRLTPARKGETAETKLNLRLKCAVLSRKIFPPVGNSPVQCLGHIGGDVDSVRDRKLMLAVQPFRYLALTELEATSAVSLAVFSEPFPAEDRRGQFPDRHLVSVSGLRHPIARAEPSGVVEPGSEYRTTQFWGTSSQTSFLMKYPINAPTARPPTAPTTPPATP